MDFDLSFIRLKQCFWVFSMIFGCFLMTTFAIGTILAFKNDTSAIECKLVTQVIEEDNLVDTQNLNN